MKFTFTWMFIMLAMGLMAQTTIDFESAGLATDEYNNNAGDTGTFDFEALSFPNSYNPEWGSWSSWALSATTDTETPGYTNQYSSITGNGNNQSTTYATTYVAGHTQIKSNIDEAVIFDGLYINNSTYGYLSIQEGDSFAKKFGGETGNDPDFFLLTVRKFLDGTLDEDNAVEFYLADYRFEDNSQDYIIADWTYLDLSSLGAADSLQFSLSSSDNGDFGMNTPAYFCIDDVSYSTLTNTTNLSIASIDLYPNPVVETLTINYATTTAATTRLFDIQGREMARQTLAIGQNTHHIDLSTINNGIYTLVIETTDGIVAQEMIVKQ